MHAEISGTVDFKEPNDHMCIARLQSLVGKIGERPGAPFSVVPYGEEKDAPRYAAEEMYGLIDPDPAKRERTVIGLQQALTQGGEIGCTRVLLVPGVVNKQVDYAQCWQRSIECIKRCTDAAEKAKCHIAIENVWNAFLLSPLEFANYVDSFKSPWAKAYCDVGNMVLYGYPQDWVRTLGKRICKVHLKDFSFRQDPAVKKRVADFVNLRDGDIDWKALHKAFADIGYKGDATVELAGGDAAYLKDVSKRFDMFLDGV